MLNTTPSTPNALRTFLGINAQPHYPRLPTFDPKNFPCYHQIVKIIADGQFDDRVFEMLLRELDMASQLFNLLETIETTRY